MPDIKISIIGNTASFDDAAIRALNNARKSAKGIQDSFDGIDLSESKAGLMTMDEILGVHIPRHVTALISQLPLLGAAMALAFPVFAIVAVVKAITELIEKQQKHAEELNKAKAETMDVVEAMGKHARAIEISNLKLQDQINILQKKPAMNGPKILAEEAKDAARKLIEEYDKAIAKVDEFAKKNQQGLIMKFLNGDDGSRELAGMVSAHEAAIAEIKADRIAAEIEGNKAAVKASDDALVAENVSFDKYIRKRLQAIQDEITARTKAHKVSAHDDDGNPLEDVTVQESLAEATRNVNTAHAQELAILAPLIMAKKEYNKAASAQAENNNLKAEEEQAKAQAEADKFVQQILHNKNKILSATQRANEEAKEEVTAQAALSKWAEFQYNTAQKQEALDNQHALNTNKIAELDSSIANSQAEHNAKMQVAQGYLTEQKADEQALATLKANQVRDLKAANDLLDQQKAKLDQLGKETMFGMTGSDQLKAEYQKALTDYQNFKLKQLELTKTTDAQINALELKLANTEGSQWRKMFREFSQVQKNMGNVYRQTLQGMNSSLASFVTTGEGNWRNLATSAIESIIQVGLQYEEQKLGMELQDLLGLTKKKATNAAAAQSSAGAAAANTLADAPWPINVGAAAAVFGQGEAYAADALAERGAVLPNHDMLVHTHPKEMILPSHISNFIVNAASNSSGQGGSGIHFVSAPQVQAIDGPSVQRMLKKHQDDMWKEFNKQMRRRNLM